MKNTDRKYPISWVENEIQKKEYLEHKRMAMLSIIESKKLADFVFPPEIEVRTFETPFKIW